jgi:precorrin-8X/cobalt-precorrin-8 methylmutase
MLFDAYLAVDWSASSKPKLGRDSVWLCLHGREPENPPTRAAATARIRELLAGLVGEGKRVLVGFDFPFGYPRGFGGWRDTWNLLRAEIRDEDDNRNNRFEVAARINERFGGHGPFWGGAVSRGRGSLAGLAELRATEGALRVQSPWKLAGAGSVGSQALVGIPRVASLREDPELAEVSRVWPFEPIDGARIVHAEIWPGVVPLEPLHPVRDAAQVATLVAHWAALDAADALAPLFDRDGGDEGWILGA